MPGTYGSAEGLLLYVGMAALLAHSASGVWLLCAGVIALTLLSLWIIRLALPHFTSDDPSAVVLDEVAGQALTLLPLAFLGRDPLSDWLAAGAGFILFRAFDALKPWPIWKLGHFAGALGVLADDLGAAVAAGLVLFGIGGLGWL
jgi:phosphatidylglycerophosphatase A